MSFTDLIHFSAIFHHAGDPSIAQSPLLGIHEHECEVPFISLHTIS